MMTNSVVKNGYDAKKLPLGQIDEKTVLEGYKVLKKLEKVIIGKEKGDLSSLSSEFYTLIPHDFGFKKMANFIINNQAIVKDKLQLVEQLGDIQIANKLMKSKSNEELNEIDNNYHKLGCKI
jgi:poly [ADP-ribose] polymerase